MKTRLHKIISIFLVAVMLLTAAPLSGFVGLDLNLDWLNFNMKAYAESNSGFCGLNVSWTFNKDSGELVLSGSGSTYDYDPIAFSEYASWYSQRNLIKSIVIEEGVTQIGAYTFCELPNVESITFPNSMRTLLGSSFSDCPLIKNISLGNKITSISASTFAGTTFYKDESNWENGALYLSNCLIDVKTDFSGEFVLKENTRVIASKAFYNCKNITSITIPSSVLYINVDAFSGCTGLSEAFYPETFEQWKLISIGSGNNHLLKCMIVDTLSERPHYLPGNYGKNMNGVLYADGEFVTEKGLGLYYSFGSDVWSYYKSKFKKVVILDGYSSIGQNAFKDCENLVEVTIPESVTVIWHSAFENCTSLKSITIPSNVKDIYGGTFNNCTSLENIIILGEIETVGSEAFRNTALPFDGNELYIQGHLVELKESVKGHYTVKEGTVGIGGSVFEGMKEMTSITIPEGVKYIGNAAFYSCTGLKELTIPEGCTTIYDEAFTSCTGLDFLKLPLSITYIERDDAFTFLDDVKILYPGTESQWKSISWGYYSLSNDYFDCLILECDSDRPYYRVSKCGNNAYAKLYTDGELLIYGYGEMRSDIYDEYMGYESFSWTWSYKKSEITSITVSEGITYIYPNAFVGCSNLTSVSLPASLRTIDTNAFVNQKMETVYFAGTQEQWNSIGYSAWGSSNPKIIFGVSHEHSYSSKVTKEPTCTLTGMMLYSCICGDSYIETIPVTEHILENYYSAPTCVAQGYECDKCTVCGEEFNRRNYEDMGNHTWANEYVAPTCLNDGYYCLKCSVCSAQKDVVVLPKLQHTSFEWVVLSDATCDEPGVKIQRCTVCLTEVDRVDTPALGHKAGEWAVETEATCEHTGLKAQRCTVCAEILNSEILPKLDHVAGEWEKISEATCTEIGVAVQKCVNCKTELDRVETSALGHTPGEWKVESEATCQNDGLKVQRCIICTEILDSEVLPSTEHVSSGWVMLSEPTCKEGGIMVQKCKFCDVELECLKTSTLEHTPAEWSVETETTCKTAGLKVQRCAVCSEIINSEIIPKLEHTPGNWETVSEVSCEKNGIKVLKCLVCKMELDREETSAAGHTPGEWQIEIEATCAHTGLNVQRCKKCSQIISREEIPSPVHTPGDWELVREADCENGGLSIKKCSVCLNEIERSETPEKGHNPGEWVVEAEPSCISYGLNVQRCLTCNKIVDNSIILKTSHTPGEWVIETEPTCTQVGITVQNCSVCNAEMNRGEIPTLAHQADEWIIETQATCNSMGIKKQQCLKCSTYFNIQTIPKLNHSYGEWTIISEPTSTQTGEKSCVCVVCSAVVRQVISPTGFEPANGLQIDFKNDIIYGLDAGCTSLDSYSNLLTDSYSWSYTNTDGRLGTGSTAVLTRGNAYSEYTIVIFGDVNGDGWYDGTDSIIVSCLANGLLSKDDVSPAFYTAADCNHDGVIDSFDVAILEQAGLLLANVDQSKSSDELATDEAYIEYLDLIDQSPETELEEDEIPKTEDKIETPETEEFSIFEFFIELIKKFIELILSYIPVPLK